MDKLDAVGLQRDAAVGIAALCPILQVAPDGSTDGRELTAYLMVTPRHQLHLKERVAVALADDAIAQLRFLRVGHLVVVGIGFVLLLVAGEPVS